jgi:diguanylate cyclase (GGDEF)-like protein
MNDMGRLSLLLIGPGTLAVFGLGFLWAWLIERRRHYLLLLAGACILFALGALTQIFHLPRDPGINAIISNVLYTCAVLMAAEGLLRRSDKRFGLMLDLALLAGFSVLIWYFFYVDRNLLARIYIQNFGFGLILLVAAVRLTKLARGRAIDRALFWVLLLFALQFFPRTVFTLGFSAPEAGAFAQSLFWQMLQLSLAVLGAGLAFTILAAAVTDVIDDLRRERDLDRLTGVLNRRGFEERVDRILASSSETAALILCDLDHFKRINDTYGHSAGDEVLRSYGALLRRNIRKRDVVGRIGGEEFAILLPDTDAEGAGELVARLRGALAEMTSPLPDVNVRISASIGIAVSDGHEQRPALMARADIALYQAKNAGRDRVVLFCAERPDARQLFTPFPSAEA